MSNKKNYSDMFKSPLFSQEVAAQHIHDARNELKRHDMIVWFLKHYKYHTLKNALASTDGSGTEFAAEQRWLSNFEKSHPTWKNSEPRIGDVNSFLKHIIDLNIYELNQLRFHKESYDEALGIASKIEDEWNETLAYEAVKGYGRKIISFPDGSAWFDLEKAGCSIEKDAMGHCGNGSGRPGQTLLSYRRPAGRAEDDMWSSRLTFVLDKNTGALGEMKGRANEKPADRYHPYIIELLKSDRIKKLAGGGYMPECNFSLQDLSVNDRDELLATKPSVFSVTDLAKIFGRNLSGYPVDIAAAITVEIGSEPIIIKETKWRKVIANMDYDDICKSFNLKVLPNYTEHLKDNHLNIDYIPSIEHHCYAEDMINKLKEKDSEIFTRLTMELQNSFGDEEFNLDSAKGIIKALIFENDELKDAVERSLSDGDELGAMEDLCDAFENYLKYPLSETNGVILKRIEDGDYDTFDLLVSDDYILQTVSAHEIDEYQCETLKDTILNWIDEAEKKEDLEVPRYGFSGFDEDVALDSLCERLKEYLPEITKADSVELQGVAPFRESNNPEAMLRLAKQVEPSGMGF